MKAKVLKRTNNMRILLLLFLSLFYFKISISQVVNICFIDTNYININTGKLGIYYTLKSPLNLKWNYFEYNKKRFYTLVDTIIGKVALSFIDSTDQKIIERKYYQDKKLNCECEMSIFMCVDSILIDEYEPSFYKIQIYPLKIRNGKYRLFYENGRIKSQGVYKSDSRFRCEYKTGEWIYYYENGGISKNENYIVHKNISICKGDYKEFYDNGKIRIQGYYDIFNLNDDLIKKIYEIYFKTDDWNLSLKEGEWEEYDSNGKLIKKTFYEKNKPIKEVDIND